MPKLLAFLPCERVIIGQGDNGVSLIVLVQHLQLKSFGRAETPNEDMAVMANFSLFSQWQFLPDEDDKVFEVSYTLSEEGKKPKFRIESPEIKKTPAIMIHRLVATVEAIPFLQPGKYEIGLWLREKGRDWPESALALYPIEVTHAPSAVMAPST